jgi:cytokinin dehydrogenase
MVTCSKEKEADLFDAVLGGLGQFGVITRARIPLVPAPARARWVRLFYTSAAGLTSDQERLIDVDLGGALSGLMDYVEGSVLIGGWRSSFVSGADAARVGALAERAGGVLYCLEGAMYYGGACAGESDVDKVKHESHSSSLPPPPRGPKQRSMAEPTTSAFVTCMRQPTETVSP